MIFVTLGTSDYPFTRLLKQIDDLNETLELKNMEIEELNLDLKKYEDNLTNTEQKVESNMEMI